MTDEKNKNQKRLEPDDANITKHFANRLKSVRHSLGLTQKAFCEKINVASKSYYSEIEGGKTRPGFDFIYKLGFYLKLNPYYLLYGEEPMFLSDKPERDLEFRDFDFGILRKPVHEMLYYMTYCDHLKYAALAFFSNYKHEYSDMLADHIKDVQPFQKHPDQ